MTGRHTEQSENILEGIYETHLEVSDLEESIEFYERLGLSLDRVEEDRRIAFFNLDAMERSMVGLWETDDIHDGPSSHFAFRVAETNVEEMREFLTERGIDARSAFGVEPSDQPLVHPWTATASMYFYDPDGNSLELLVELSDAPREGLEAMSLHDWQQLTESTE